VHTLPYPPKREKKQSSAQQTSATPVEDGLERVHICHQRDAAVAMLTHNRLPLRGDRQTRRANERAWAADGKKV
jgi:hypothetical protein